MGWIAVVACLLAACASTPPPPLTAVIVTPPPATPDAGAPTVAAPVPSETAPPTEALVAVGYLAEAGGALEAVVQQAAQGYGWTYERALEPSPEALDRLIESGADAIVLEAVLGQRALEIAPSHPQVYFIFVYPAEVGQGVAAPAADWPANVLFLGGPGSRLDQAGFLAGLAAGFATATDRVAAVGEAVTPTGRSYRNGFQNGVRYSCPKCRIDFADWPDSGNQAQILFAAGTDVFFHAVAGDDGQAAAAALASQGAQVITAYPPQAGASAELFLTSVYVDPAGMLQAALAAYQAGHPASGQQPFSLAAGAITLAPYQDPGSRLSPLDRQDIEAVTQRLADLSLETGIDPATGAER